MKLSKPADMASVRTIGIPRALLYHRYGVQWTTFFEQLGLTCVLSPETDRAIMDQGTALSIDESCLSSKIFLGHVAALIGNCDAIFIPRIANYGEYRDMCTKFHALPDLTRHAFHDQAPCILDTEVDLTHKRPEKPAFLELGLRLGKTKKETLRAYDAACKAQERDEKQRAKALHVTLKKSSGLRILLVGHPYVLRDDYLGTQPARILTEMGATVLFADDWSRNDARKACRSFSNMIPWMISRELVGAILSMKDKVDGIVLLTAFPCGPDSMINEMIIRRIKDKPILQLTLDAQSGTAGLETRLESFVDILHYKKEGGYGNRS
ncbi:MAG: acyl-CoA dehydratase activase-related protein [Eubacteriales bacterium]|nr:acyl-CoA dehydratase activase-related protein [Eubacteriales bacterium]